jgi:hypothetical protein
MDTRTPPPTSECCDEFKSANTKVSTLWADGIPRPDARKALKGMGKQHKKARDPLIPGAKGLSNYPLKFWK